MGSTGRTGSGAPPGKMGISRLVVASASVTAVPVAEPAAFGGGGGGGGSDGVGVWVLQVLSPT